MITGRDHFQGDIVKKNRGEENFQNHWKDTKLQLSNSTYVTRKQMIFNQNPIYIDQRRFSID
jgi:hypothetical protein